MEELIDKLNRSKHKKTILKVNKEWYWDELDKHRRGEQKVQSNRCKNNKSGQNLTYKKEREKIRYQKKEKKKSILDQKKKKKKILR